MQSLLELYKIGNGPSRFLIQWDQKEQQKNLKINIQKPINLKLFYMDHLLLTGKGHLTRLYYQKKHYRNYKVGNYI